MPTPAILAKGPLDVPPRKTAPATRATSASRAPLAPKATGASKTTKTTKTTKATKAAKTTKAGAVPSAADPLPDGPGVRAVDTVGRPGAPAQGRELRARGKATMRKLLDGGIEVFSKRGYHSARVDDIVKAAKTSHGTFYLYFSSKEDLFQALVADVAEEIAVVTAALGPITADDDGRAELRRWLERFTAMYEHYGPIIRTWTEAEIGESEAGRMGTDVLAELAVAVQSRLPRGGRGFDPTIAALAVTAMIERFNYFVLSGQVDADRDELLDTLAAVVFEALFAPT